MTYPTSYRIADALHHAGIAFERDVPLRRHTTFRIGGPAEFFVDARNVETVAGVIRIGRQLGVPVRCIGGGSNLLVSDEGVRGIVVVNRIAHLRWDGVEACVGAGYGWDELVASSVDRGVGGIAAMSGIPGSVGGAIYGNAGAYGECVSDRLVKATVVAPDGEITTRAQAELRFGYRGSALKDSGDVVVEATFALDMGDRVELSEQRDMILKTRAEKHPRPDEPTAGSYFKNIDDFAVRTRLIRELALPDTGHRIAAGLLLDRVGARGHRVGDAQVFDKHANIIVNCGLATALDVVRLSDWMRGAVDAAFNVQLEPEVIWLGEPVRSENR